ncbi:MAG: CinA family protein [Breznakia sp.]
MQQLVSLLYKKGLCIASIESLTAGLFAAKIAEVENASRILKGALVTYQTQAKIETLKIPSSFFENNAVISRACVEQMVRYGMQMFHCDVVVACSGNAGPGALDNEPVGKVFMAILYQGNTTCFEKLFQGNRNQIREQVCTFLAKQVCDIVNC